MSALSLAPDWTRWWFRGAAVYGAVALLLALLAPPPSAGLAEHYGFLLTALAFQGGFWVIGGDPARYRSLMPWSVAEKLAFGVPCAVLFASHRLDATTVTLGLIDLALGVGFVLAWRATPAA